jgi:hypothetical protein
MKVMEVIHRVGGRRHWRGKHRYYDSTSDRYLAEHDKSSRLSRIGPGTVRTQCKMFK